MTVWSGNLKRQRKTALHPTLGNVNSLYVNEGEHMASNQHHETDNLADLRAIAAEEKHANADFYRRKMAAVVTAQENGATKDTIANNLGISRPTLDAWIRDCDDRILFNDALALLAKPGITTADAKLLDRLYSALGIRSIPTQAEAVLEGMHWQKIDKAALTGNQAELLGQAINRAWQLVDRPDDGSLSDEKRQAALMREAAARHGYEIIATTRTPSA